MTSSSTENLAPATPAQTAVSEHLRLLTSGQLDAWATLFADDAVFAFPFAPSGMPAELRGHDALTPHMRNFVATFDVEAVDLTFVATADPHETVAKWVLDGTATPAGRRFQQPCVGIVRLDDNGRIVRFEDYWNPLVAIAALESGTEDAEEDAGIAGSFGA